MVLQRKPLSTFNFSKSRQISLIIISLAIVGCLWEIFARLDDLIVFGAPFFKRYSYDTMLLDQDEFGRRGKANGRYEKWILNSHGFRGPEVALEKPENTIRIVAFGASETFGLYESSGKEWPNQLRTALEQLYPHKRIEVINAAIAGLGLEGSGDYFKNRLLKFNPDIVLCYQDFVAYLNKEWVDQHSAPGAPRKNNKRGTAIAKVGGNISFVNQLRIIPKLKQAIKEKAPKVLANWVTERIIRKRYYSIDQKNQIGILNNYQIANYERKLRNFVTFMRERNITVILSEHCNKILAGPDEQNMGALITLWGYNPLLSSKVFRKGYPICNGVIEKVARETGSYFVGQKTLLDNAEENFVIDGVHLTDLGAETLMKNFLEVLKRVLEKEFHLKPREVRTTDG